MNDVGGRTVEHTIHVDARPETVWRFLIDPERLLQWWGRAEVDARPGGTIRVSMREGPRPIMRGEFIELVPYRRIAFTFGWEATPGHPIFPRLLACRGDSRRARRWYPAHPPAQRTATDARRRDDRRMGAYPEPPHRSHARPTLESPFNGSMTGH